MTTKLKGVRDRRFVTVTEIATELRVRVETLRDSGVLEHCRCIPAGTLGRSELWLWEDVQASALALGEGRTTSQTSPKPRGVPASRFVSL